MANSGSNGSGSNGSGFKWVRPEWHCYVVADSADNKIKVSLDVGLPESLRGKGKITNRYGFVSLVSNAVLNGSAV